MNQEVYFRHTNYQGFILLQVSIFLLLSYFCPSTFPILFWHVLIQILLHFSPVLDLLHFQYITLTLNLISKYYPSILPVLSYFSHLVLSAYFPNIFQVLSKYFPDSSLFSRYCPSNVQDCLVIFIYLLTFANFRVLLQSTARYIRSSFK